MYSQVELTDQPRAGDIAAFHDARLKGRKGLQSYEQHVGSVEEPLLGIVVEYEQKNKHKIRVLQVERGVPEEVSYRLDDLKSGKVVVSFSCVVWGAADGRSTVRGCKQRKRSGHARVTTGKGNVNACLCHGARELQCKCRWTYPIFLEPWSFRIGGYALGE